MRCWRGGTGQQDIAGGGMMMMMMMCTLVDDLQSGVSDVHCRAKCTSVPSPVDVLSAPVDCHVQVRRQQKLAKNQLPHVHGE